MAIFGLGSAGKSPKKSTKKSAKKAGSSKGKKGQSSEAKAILNKMKAKKDAGDCAFC